MNDNDWITKDTTVQVLLDAEAQISNFMYNNPGMPGYFDGLLNTRAMLHKQIEMLRGPAPVCYGEDDCSTEILSRCPWRMTCGS